MAFISNDFSMTSFVMAADAEEKRGRIYIVRVPFQKLHFGVVYVLLHDMRSYHTFING